MSYYVDPHRCRWCGEWTLSVADYCTFCEAAMYPLLNSQRSA